MYTVKEAAEKLRISPATIYALCAEAKIRHERYGRGRGTIRIAEEALEEYRRGCEVIKAASVPPPEKPQPKAKPRFEHLKL